MKNRNQNSILKRLCPICNERVYGRSDKVYCQRKLSKRAVEIDETLYGGIEANKHKDKKTPNNQGRSTKTKSAILGIIERNGYVYAVPVVDTRYKRQNHTTDN